MFVLKLKTESLTEQYGDHRKLSNFACYFFCHFTRYFTKDIASVKFEKSINQARFFEKWLYNEAA